MATGFGMALTMPAATTAVVESAPGDRAGAAAGVINASRQVGGLIGVALLGSLVSGGLDAGLRPALLVAAGAFAVGALAAAGWIGRPGAHGRADARRGTGARDASARAEPCSDYR
jgi:MFS transporter, DHA2 family, methylenomycin A resistance protein